MVDFPEPGFPLTSVAMGRSWHVVPGPSTCEVPVRRALP